MAEPLTDQQLAAITELAAQVIAVLGDDWPLHTDADEVAARFEDSDPPLVEFVDESIRNVPLLVAEIRRLRAAREEAP